MLRATNAGWRLWMWSCCLLVVLVPVNAPAQQLDLPPAGGESFRILEDNAGRIDRFVMHISVGQLELLEPTLRTWLPQLGQHTQGEFVCAEQKDQAELNKLLRKLKLEDRHRFHVHLWPDVETIWARDRYLAARDQQNRAVILCEPELAYDFDGDFRVPKFLQGGLPQWRLQPADLYLEGGDLIAGRNFVLVGATTVRTAMADFDGLTTNDLHKMLERQLGKRVIFLPDVEEMPLLPGTLDYHLDMFVTVLADDTVLLADLDWGRRLARRAGLPDSEPGDDERAAFLDPVSFAEAGRRLNAVQRALERANIQVRRLPAHLFQSRDCVATYNNCLQEDTPLGPVVYLPHYDTGILDHEAANTYRQLGYRVCPVDVRPLYPLKGTLRCVVNVVERSALEIGPPVPAVVPMLPAGDVSTARAAID